MTTEGKKLVRPIVNVPEVVVWVPEKKKEARVVGKIKAARLEAEQVDFDNAGFAYSDADPGL